MKVVIIGAVAAGMSCAAKLRRLDDKIEIVVYEKTDTISYSACGIPYYIGKKVSSSKKLLVRSVEDFEKEGIKVHTNKEVVGIDIDKKTVEIEDLNEKKKFKETYDKLVIATGANAIRPKIDGIELGNIYNVKSIKDGINIKNYLDKLKNISKEQKENQKEKPQKGSKGEGVIIIGGGYIGMEMVEAVHNWEIPITLIEMSKRILNGFDPEISEIVEKYLIEKGVELKLGEEVKSFEKFKTKEEKKNIKEENVGKVITDKGEYESRLVILGLGFQPATGFLKGTDIEIDEKGGIVIDRYMQTNIKDVYAAGDCAQVYNEILEKNSYIPLGTNANKQGKHLAGVINGEKTKIQGTLGSAVVKIIDMEVGKTGLSEQEAKDAKINYGKSFIKSSTGPEYYPQSEEIYVKIIYNQDNKQIIGGQVVGKKDAGIRTDILATAIYKKMTLQELGMLDLCYAPPFSNVWDAVSIAAKIAEKK